LLNSSNFRVKTTTAV